jgi:tetratricopeptide (TPR) repeat protein
VAYHPVIDILKSNFDIGEDDGDEAIRDKVSRGLKALEVDEVSTLPYLLELLSVKDSGIDQFSLSPEGRKDRTLQALNRMIVKGAEIRPLILAVEDLHWMDKSSEDALKDWLEHIAGSRVLLIFTHRTEYEHVWGSRSYHSQITLNRLSNRETYAMMTHLLGTQEVAENLANLILEKTEGVPFFVEEFVKSLRDLEIIERQDHTYALTRDPRDVTIPSTIQDVLQARVDALPEGAKEVLQTGAVIEREVPYTLLERVTGLAEGELLSHVSVLKDAELLYERGVFPQSTYVFKHALTREVVYESILGKRKKELHEAAGKAIEQIYRDNLDDHYGVLCEHFMAGGNYERGETYSRLAAKNAEKVASLLESVDYAKKTIACLEKLDRTEDVDRRIIDTRVTVGTYLSQITSLTEAKAIIDPIVGLAEEKNYRKRVAQIYTILGTYSVMVQDNDEDGLKHLSHAVKISDEVNDRISSTMAHFWYANALARCCKFEQAIYHAKIPVEINVKAGNMWGMATMKSTLSLYYNWASMILESHEASSEALSIAEKSGDVFSKGTAHVSHGFSCLSKGDLRKAEEHLLRGAEFCERAKIVYWTAMAHGWLGDTYHFLREHEKSKSSHERSAWYLENAREWPSFGRLNRACVLRADVLMDNHDIDLEALRKYTNGNRIKRFVPDLARVMGEVLLTINDSRQINEAEHWLNKALETDTKHCTHWGAAQDHVLYGELYKKKGDLQRTRESLGKAAEKFTECGADGWVTRTEEKLAQL